MIIQINYLDGSVKEWHPTSKCDGEKVVPSILFDENKVRPIKSFRINSGRTINYR